MLLMRKKINPYLYPGLDISPSEASIATIVMAVKEVTEISWEELISKSRVMDVKDARHLLIYFLRKKTRLTWSKIGDVLNKNHATAIHAYERVNALRDYDYYYKKHIPAVNNLINLSNN